jgi:hypothetical protein
MATTDPEQERRRLAEFYSAQADGILEQVAGRAYELTESAREVLRAEMAKRGLNAPIVPYRPGDEVEMRNMAVVRRFRDLPEALLAKGSLDSAGIDCALVDDNVVRMDWLWSNGMGGIKLQVDAADAAAAEAILAQPIPENFDVSGVGEYEQPRCPKCGSLDINFHELDPAAYLSLAVSVPIPFRRRAWRCHSCHAEWEDDGVPEANGSAS